MIKAVFSASLLQSSVSRDPSEIILYADLLLKTHYLLLSMLKTVVLHHIFVQTFSDIINVTNVTFGQINASLLHKNIIF